MGSIKYSLALLCFLAGCASNQKYNVSNAEIANAKRHYDAALSIEKNAINLKGDELTKKLRQAIEEYSKAIVSYPEFADAYQNRAGLFARLGKNEKAERDYNEAIALNQRNPVFYNNRGTFYKTLKRYDEAEKDFAHAIELNNPAVLPFAYLNRGALYYEVKKYDLAVADFQKALTLAQNPQVRQSIEAILKTTKKLLEGKSNK